MDQNNDRLVGGVRSGRILAIKSLTHAKDSELASS